MKASVSKARRKSPWWQREWLEKKEIKAELYERQGGLCAACGCEMVLDTPLLLRSAELDHVRAKSRKGKDEIDNYQLLCRSDNGRKRAKPDDVFKNLYTAEPGTLRIKL